MKKSERGLLAGALTAGTFGTAMPRAGGGDALLFLSPRVVAESTVRGRKMAQYEHESVPGWGNAKTQTDVL